MACSTRPGPAKALGFVAEHSEVKPTQDEWHAMRMLAMQEEGATGSRRRATPEEVDAAVAKLADTIAYEMGYNEPVTEDAEGNARRVHLDDFHGDWLNPSSGDSDWIERSGHGEFHDDCVRLAQDLKDSNVTLGTLEILGYMAAWGPEDAVERARKDIAAKKDESKKKPVDDSDICDECGAVMGRTSMVGPEHAPSCSLYESDDYGDRVRHLEDTLGVSTSDAQAMVDAEDLLAKKRAEAASAARPGEEGPYGKARLGSKYTGWRDAAEIARDVRGDLKRAKADGQIPEDVKVSVKTHKYAGGQAVDVKLSGWPVERVYTEDVDAYGIRGRRYSDEARALMDTVENIRESYNRDASDSQQDYFDNTYYGNTSWDVY